MVGVRGFEPPTPCSRSRCATRLRYTPISGLGAENKGFLSFGADFVKVKNENKAARFGPFPGRCPGIVRESGELALCSVAYPHHRLPQFQLANRNSNLCHRQTQKGEKMVLSDTHLQVKETASAFAVQRTADDSQVFGGLGQIQGKEAERLCRNSKTCQICEGANQNQRMIIAHELMKMGRRHSAEKLRVRAFQGILRNHTNSK
jgi:cyclohexane-1-carbonyl-CoA dehydrogenase